MGLLKFNFVSALALLLAACAGTAPLPPLDLSAPGWQVRQAQAVWKPGAEKPEIAGDLVLSSHPSGGTYLQFSKTLPLVSARLTGTAWEVEFPPEQKRYSGRGNPPKRIVWLQLIRALDGGRISDRWRVVRPSTQFMALQNDESGERLEVHFQQ